MKFDRVVMEAVPEPERAHQSKFNEVYAAIAGLPPGEKFAIKVVCDSPKQRNGLRVAIVRYFRMRDKRALTSRTDKDPCCLWAWLMEKK